MKKTLDKYLPKVSLETVQGYLQEFGELEILRDDEGNYTLSCANAYQVRCLRCSHTFSATRYRITSHRNTNRCRSRKRRSITTGQQPFRYQDFGALMEGILEEGVPIRRAVSLFQNPNVTSYFGGPRCPARSTLLRRRKSIKKRHLEKIGAIYSQESTLDLQVDGVTANKRKFVAIRAIFSQVSLIIGFFHAIRENTNSVYEFIVESLIRIGASAESPFEKVRRFSSDSAGTMISVWKNLPGHVIHLPCICHRLNNIGVDFSSLIPTFISDLGKCLSNLRFASDVYREWCGNHGITPAAIHIPCKTRWVSYFDMAQVVYNQRDALLQFADEIGYTHVSNCLKNDGFLWHLRAILVIGGKISGMIALMEGEYVSANAVASYLDFIDDFSNLDRIKSVFTKAMVDYSSFPLPLQDAISQWSAKLTETRIPQLLTTESFLNIHLTMDPWWCKNNDVHLTLDDFPFLRQDEPEIYAIYRYIGWVSDGNYADPEIPAQFGDDLSMWWRSQCDLFPEIYIEVAELLRAPLTSCGIERAFSQLKQVYNSNKTRLHYDNLETESWEIVIRHRQYAPNP